MIHNQDHAQQMKDLLLQQFKGKTNWEALLGAWAVSIQYVEDMLYQLFSQRGVDTAVGRQLDVLGAIVGETRNNATDEGFRIRIKTRIIRNVSSGTVDSILLAFDLLFTDTYSFVLTESFPGEVMFEVANTSIYGNVSDSQAADYLSVLKDLVPAGVGVNFVYHPLTANATYSYPTLFCFSTDNAKGVTSTTQGFGDGITGGSNFTGGRWSGALGNL